MRLGTAVGTAVMLLATSAKAEGPGGDLVIAGGAAIVAGAAGLAMVPACARLGAKAPCASVALGAGIGFASLGIVLLVDGKEQQRAWAERASRASLSILPGGAAVGWSGRF